MNKLAKRLLAILIMIVISAIISFAVEILFFNYHALKVQNSGSKLYSSQDLIDYTVGFILDGSDLISNQENSSLSIYVDNSYYSKLVLDYESANDGSIQVQSFAYDASGNTNVQNIQDYYDYRLTKSITNINQYCYKLVIHFPQTGIIIKKMELTNKVSVNYLRILFLYVCILISLIILLGKKSMFIHAHSCFFVISMMLGVLLLILVPLRNPIVWDDETHFARIYRQSFIRTVSWTQAANEYIQRKVPYSNSVEEQNDVFDYLNLESINRQIESVETKSMFVPYNMRSYLPQSIMIALARLLNLNFGYMQIFGRLGGYIFYVLVIFYAIKISKTAKRLISVIALLPTPIFMAANFSYDPFIIALSILGFVIFANEYLDRKSNLSMKNTAIFIIAIVVASFSKAIYVPLILLALLFPVTKFYSRRQMLLFKLGVLILFTVMMSSFVLPTLLNPPIIGDVRGGETTSIAGQLRFIVNNPIFYFRLLTRSIWDNIGMFFFGNMALLNFAYLGPMTNNMVYLVILLLMFSAMTDVPDERYAFLNSKDKVYIAMLLLSIMCLIWSALYISFTPVGLNQINGVQPRYYIPLLLPLLYLFRNKQIITSIDHAILNKITFAASSFIVLNGIYTQILKPFNF